MVVHIRIYQFSKSIDLDARDGTDIVSQSLKMFECGYSMQQDTFRTGLTEHACDTTFLYTNILTKTNL